MSVLLRFKGLKDVQISTDIVSNNFASYQQRISFDTCQVLVRGSKSEKVGLQNYSIFSLVQRSGNKLTICNYSLNSIM